jgi:very-short-patch-repair endonuclease
MSSESDHTPIDRRIAAIAARQHGVVSLGQLVAVGLGARGVRDRVGAGRLHRIHQGVFAVGHAGLSLDGRRMAAVLACGPGAVLSYRDAAALHGIRPSNSPRFDVTSPQRTGRRKPGVRVHSGATLTAADVIMVRGIPCTTVARTLLDLAEVVPKHQLQRAIARAEMLGVLDLIAIHQVLARARGRRGAPVLKFALAEDPALSDSEIEDLLFDICRRANVPRPLRRYWIGSYEADFAWPQHRLIAEADGRAAHGTRHAFEHDRLRDRRLAVAGWRVIRFTWRQLRDDPQEVAATLRALLS